MRQVIQRSIRLFVLFVFSLTGLSTAAHARPPGPPPHVGEPLEHLVETLGLDEATLAKVYQVIDAARAETRELRRKLHEAHQHMRTLLEQETPDEAAVMAQAGRIGTQRTEMEKQRLRTLLQVRALLTPEQRAKLLQALRSRHRHERPEPPPPSEGP
jgi:Spy/CpxP family protein refolding chaperone